MSDAAVSWKPAGWQSVICGLSIPNAKAALDFYKDAFGAELIGMMLDKKGEMVMHASIKLHDTVFYVSDPYPELGYPASTLNAFFYVPDCDAAFKKAVAAGAKEVSAPAQQFWGGRQQPLHALLQATHHCSTDRRVLPVRVCGCAVLALEYRPYRQADRPVRADVDAGHQDGGAV